MGPGMKGFRPRSVDSTCVFKNNASFVKGIERTESIGRGKLVKNGPLHDSFFKGALGNPEVMAAALRGLLPKEYAERMDFDRLVFLPGESVGEGLGSSRMDLVFSVPLDGKEILLLLSWSTRADPIRGFTFSCSSTFSPFGTGPSATVTLRDLSFLSFSITGKSPGMFHPPCPNCSERRGRSKKACRIFRSCRSISLPIRTRKSWAGWRIWSLRRFFFR